MHAQQFANCLEYNIVHCQHTPIEYIPAHCQGLGVKHLLYKHGMSHDDMIIRDSPKVMPNMLKAQNILYSTLACTRMTKQHLLSLMLLLAILIQASHNRKHGPMIIILLLNGVPGQYPQFMLSLEMVHWHWLCMCMHIIILLSQ